MNTWEKLKVSGAVIAAVLIPVVLAVLGNRYTQAIKEREVEGRFVELAVSILAEPASEENRNLRHWAIKVVNEYSGVQIDSATASDLVEGSRFPTISAEVSRGYRIPTIPREITEVIISDTQSRDLEAELAALRQFGVSYHYLVDVTGEVRRLVNEAHVAYHTQRRNENSIGIGLIHVAGEDYTQAQLGALKELLSDIVARRAISPDNIRAKSEVDARKRCDILPILNEIRPQLSNVAG